MLAVEARTWLSGPAAVIAALAAMAAPFVVSQATSGVLAATVTCPTVNPGGGAVSPAPAPGVDWSGCDLADASLGLANLTGADLSGANLTHAALVLANLTSVNLNGANLSSADVRSATLTGAELTGATLTGITSGKVTGTPAALPANWLVVAGYLAGPAANLSSAQLMSANLANADLADATLVGANLNGADLANANLTDAAMNPSSLADTNLSGTDLTDADLSSVFSGGITGSPAQLPAHWSLLDGYLIGPEANLKNADLAGQNLAGDDLAYAALTGATVTGTLLATADLTGVASGQLIGTPGSLPPNWLTIDGYLAGPDANLGTAELSGANLAGADLAGADLNSADLSNADLAGTDLSGATLTAADLTSINLTAANLHSATLVQSQLTSADLAHADLTDAALDQVSSGQLTGTPAALPADWSVTAGYLIGPGANLSQANLPGVSLGGRDLAGTLFGGATLTDADLSNADLDGADVGGANLTGASVAAASLEFADLSSANLTNADAKDADLLSADITSLQISGADLAGANLNDALYYLAPTGTPKALPDHFFFANGNLLGPGIGAFNQANLHQADLKHADLAQAVLYQANLTDADLDDANLTGTDLQDSVMTGASLTGVVWSDTLCPNGTNSNKYLDGCFSALDTTPPVVTVTGVRGDAKYVLGAAPKAGCRTTDNGTVATAATLTVTTTGSDGVGPFVATCAGAVDLAGNKAKPVTVDYQVGYGFGGFSVPKPGSTLAGSGSVAVEFRLVTGAHAAITSSQAQALSGVRVTLRGPGIQAAQASCAPVGADVTFHCAIRVPTGIQVGHSHRYTLTVSENVGAGYWTAPAVRGAVNPEVVHFR